MLSGQHAFTLLELLVVMTLMSVIVGMAVFRLDGVSYHTRLQSFAAQLNAVLGRVRTQARTSGARPSPGRPGISTATSKLRSAMRPPPPRPGTRLSRPTSPTAASAAKTKLSARNTAPVPPGDRRAQDRPAPRRARPTSRTPRPARVGKGAHSDPPGHPGRRPQPRPGRQPGPRLHRRGRSPLAP